MRFSVLAVSLLTLFFVSGCDGWIDPLPDTPQNLRLAVVTVALKEKSDSLPVVTQEAAMKMVSDASAVWTRYCGISFVPAAHFEVDARASGIPYRAVGDDAISEIRERFINPNYLTVVMVPVLQRTGEEPRGGSALLPGYFNCELLVMLGDPDFHTLAHEMGHLLGLPHVQNDEWDETSERDPRNLMFPGDFEESFERGLLPVQCEEAKRYILGYDTFRPLCRPDATDSALSKTNCPAVRF